MCACARHVRMTPRRRRGDDVATEHRDWLGGGVPPQSYRVVSAGSIAEVRATAMASTRRSWTRAIKAPLGILGTWPKHRRSGLKAALTGLLSLALPTLALSNRQRTVHRHPADRRLGARPHARSQFTLAGLAFECVLCLCANVLFP